MSSAVSYGQPCSISSSARQCSTRSISVSETTCTSAAVMYLVFGAKPLADLPLRGDLSADLAGEAQRLRLGDPAFEPHGDRPVRPEQDVAVDLDHFLAELTAAAEVAERVRRALDPQARPARHANGLDERLLADRLLQQRVVLRPVLREQHRTPVDAQD